MITEETLKDQVREALDRGADYEILKSLVVAFYASGGTKDQAYELFQDIWLSRGYNLDDGSRVDPTRDELEYMMERVWYWGQ
jgi:hypothetical protein